MESKIYIILVNYNNSKYSIECIKSIEKSLFSNYQVLIIDNSTDNKYINEIGLFLKDSNLDFINYSEEEIHRTCIEDNNIKYVLIKQHDNKGFASANNIGIRYAIKKNDFDSVLLLNNDTEILPNTILEVLNVKNNTGDNNIYGCKIYYYDEPNSLWYDGGKFSFIYGKSKHKNFNKKDNFKTSLEPVKTGFITFCFVLIPKVVIKQIGELNESFFMYFEDLEYCYRCIRNDIGLYYVPKGIIYHKVGASSGNGITEFAAYWGYKNEIKFNRMRSDKLKYFSLLFIIFTRLIIAIRWLLKRKPKMAKYAISTIKLGLIEKIS